MFYPEKFDAKNFRRLDEVYTTEFLTSMAAALAAHGLIRQSEVQEIKLSLSQWLPQADEGQPLLIRMQQSHSNFLTQLQGRFGELNLMRNHLRHGLSRQLGQIITTLSNWGTILVPKSELLFNRPFYVFVSDRCEQTKLFSSVILDLSDVIAAALRTLIELQDQASTMIANTLITHDPEDQAIDQAIAKHLGFRQVLGEGIPVVAERRIQRGLNYVLEDLVSVTESFASQIARSPLHQQQVNRLQMSCESMQGYLRQFSSQTIPDTTSLHVWEAKRIRILSAIYGLQLSLDEMIREFMATLEAYQAITSAPGVVPMDIQRSMTTALIRQGIGANEASMASQNLLEYIQQHKISPQEVIGAELAKINQHLTHESLAILQKWHGQQDLLPGSHEEKDLNLLRQQQLKKVFKKSARIASGLVSLLAILPFSGCGLKADPMSNTRDFKPSIPYQEQVLAPPEALEDTATQQPSDDKGDISDE